MGRDEMSIHRAQVMWSGGEADDARAHEIRLAGQAANSVTCPVEVEPRQ